MTAYKFLIGFAMVLICIFLWIILNDTVATIGSIFNAGITDPDAIARNNTAVALFYYTMLFIILAFALWILKSSQDNKEEPA
jgi:nitrogen fixation-related uncharacterized protein